MPLPATAPFIFEVDINNPSLAIIASDDSATPQDHELS